MIVYASRTGNVKYIVQRLNLPNIEIKEGLIVTKPFVLLTYTDGFGEVPSKVDAFMATNYQNCIGIAVTGNRNFGINFGLAGDTLSQRYNIPLIVKIDLRGQQSDYDRLLDFYKKTTGLMGEGERHETIFNIK